jgi:hypothetical protein
MSTSWRTTQFGTFEVITRQGMVGMIFGGVMLFFASCFLYWLGTALVEYFRFGTWRDVLGALPGMAVTLIMAALFGVPGVLMALLKTRTMCNRADGLIRQVKSFGVFRRVKEIRLSDVKLVTATYKITKSRASNRSGGGAEVHTVEFVLADKQRVEVAQLGKWDTALKLGRQLAGYLGVEFRNPTG